MNQSVEHTLDNWNNLLPHAPSSTTATEYFWQGASYNDVPLVRAVLEYAKANDYLMDTTHAVHLSCVYARYELLMVLNAHHPLTPHHVMTGLYSASSGCQAKVLKGLLKKADTWGHEFYQHVDGNGLMDVVCIPGDVPEQQVFECVQLIEPLLQDPELSSSVVHLVKSGHPNVAYYMLRHSSEEVLRQKAQDIQISHPQIATWIEQALDQYLKEKLTTATQVATPINKTPRKM